MSEQLDRLFAAAGNRADTVSLAGAAAARQVGTRRRRARIGTLLVACALVVAAIPIGVSQLGARRGAAPLPPAASASPAPTDGASRSAPPVEPSSTAAPDTPRLPDPCSSTPAQCYPPVRHWYEEHLPAPCAQPNHPSDALIVVRDADAKYTFVPDSNEGATLYSATLTRYRDGGAAQYMAEVRSALSRCGSVTRTNPDVPSQKTTLTYRRVSSGALGGDDSLLVTRSYRYVTEGQPATNPVFPIGLIRVGDVVAVIFDHGWEGAPTSQRRFDEIVVKARADLAAGKP
jgi:hypothetical protein